MSSPSSLDLQILTIDDLEQHATHHLPRMVRDYYNGGSQDGITLRANLEAYKRWHIRPRVLRDVSCIDTSAPSGFGAGGKVSFPCCVAPAAMQKMAHPDGEAATARAAAARGIAMGLSSFSTTSIEDVKIAAGDKAPCVLQMYLFENRDVSYGLIRRAEEAGYRAIILTVDTPYFGRRLTEIRNRFKVPPHLKMANFDDALGVKTGSHLRTEGRERPIGTADAAAIASTVPPNKNDPSLTWSVVSELKSITRLPIWLKGILTVEDAELAVAHGADGIVVSNHGGRQLDYAPATLDVLPEIARAVAGKIPVHFDGGIRRGSDIFKALCLGADMCWIGRPVLWGLAYDGEAGVKLALDILLEEFRGCMGLAGLTSLDEIKRHGQKMLIEVPSWKARCGNAGTEAKCLRDENKSKL